MNAESKGTDRSSMTASPPPEVDLAPSPFFTCDLKRILCVAALAIACLVGILALVGVNGVAQMGNAGGGALLGGGAFFLLIALWVSRTKEKAKENGPGPVETPLKKASPEVLITTFHTSMVEEIVEHLPQGVKIVQAAAWHSVLDLSSGAVAHSTPEQPIRISAQNAPLDAKAFIEELKRSIPQPKSDNVKVECFLVVRSTSDKGDCYHTVHYNQLLSKRVNDDGSIRAHVPGRTCGYFWNMSDLKASLWDKWILSGLELIKSFSYEALGEEFTC